MSMQLDLDTLNARVEAALPDLLPASSDLAPPLVEAMRYAVLGGGKRLRPMLVCAAADAFGSSVEDALAPACAMEFLHTYSLVHDDLPAMDDDALRRGRPSCHAAFGEATAILAGDALLTLAFETVAAADAIPAKRRLAALKVLTEASGWAGMVGGQAMDLARTGSELTAPELRLMHGAKTGRLIEASVCIGAHCAGADSVALALAAGFGSRIGLAFQIIDDVLDVTASTEVLGKPTGSDEELGKSTFVTALGIAAARDEAESLLQGAMRLMQEGGLQDSLLAEVGRLAVQRMR